MQRRKLGRRQPGDGIASVVLKLERQPQLFAKPDDAFGLGLAKVVNFEHEFQPVEGFAWHARARA